ncbi:MAG: CoA pyrophosphatase [Rhodocyclaceae bacterium]|jgi:8-oxo-dGTP pyrophosphatase MutT (NUDIX family)|nr:CoA pyrophosphatase [Rhodocyclaceae bacterium]MCC6879600.1 CoA pyrophosphatase [Rhodocyclaceae bacterium]MCL4679768.1 CoA pyrophosphatase [Rhodocyclaceae bacterium]
MLAPTADWLRQRLAGPLRLQAVEEDAVPQGLTSAAVLVPIIERPQGLTVLFTQRTAHLNDHAGQVSFPGGRCEETDPSPVFTALRETEEEIGLDPALVEVLGLLPEYRTGTGFSVTPVVGLVRPPFELAPDSFEVAEVFETPLAFLLDPANHQRHSMEIGGIVRHYYAMPYEGYFIWGATAGMLVSLRRLLYEE